jgi:hypothetical protein
MFHKFIVYNQYMLYVFLGAIQEIITQYYTTVDLIPYTDPLGNPYEV